MSCALVAAISFIVFVIYGVKKKDPKPIFGVYQVAGKWYYVKYFLFGCMYYFRRVSGSFKRKARQVSRCGHNIIFYCRYACDQLRKAEKERLCVFSFYTANCERLASLVHT